MCVVNTYEWANMGVSMRERLMKSGGRNRNRERERGKKERETE